MKKYSLLPILLLFISTIAFSQVPGSLKINDTLNVKTKLIHSENFDGNLSKWVKEIEPSEHSFVTVKDEKLDINVGAGCSVWFTEKMEGGILIEFDAIMVKEGGVNDNVQDLNTYWMATDPANPDDIFAGSDSRGGIFRNYFPMSLYYVGLGETHNTRSILRRYLGTGKRPFLPEHNLKESEYLLTGNELNHIRIISFGNIIKYYRNGELYFTFDDLNPLTSGYFCFRTVKNHMTIDNFKVYQLSIIEGALGIQDEVESKFTIYPNPTKDSFVIESLKTEIDIVKIFSMQGVMLFNSKDISSNKFNIDISKFKTGVYFVQIKNTQGASRVSKIIKN